MTGEPKRAEAKAGGIPRLPPGRHGLPREFVVENQRARISAGIIAAVAESGYDQVTISQIAAAAGVSRRTFYQYFRSKQDAYRAALAAIVEHLLAEAEQAGAGQEQWVERLGAELDAVLSVFAANPDLARCCLVVPVYAGEEIAAGYRAALREVRERIRRGSPTDREPSAALEQAMIGGAVAIVEQKVKAGEGERLAELRQELLAFIARPYLGIEAATRLAQAERH